MPNGAGNFSLKEVLAENPEWAAELSRKVWRDVKSSPKWAQLLDVNNRLEVVEARLGKIESCLQEILVKLNHGGGFE